MRNNNYTITPQQVRLKGEIGLKTDSFKAKIIINFHNDNNWLL